MEDLENWTHIPDCELTWMENYIWASLGYFFCEISFEWSTDFAWEYLLYPSWCNTVGNWFYGLAFDRWWLEHQDGAWK